jgi:hypothetical protein
MEGVIIALISLVSTIALGLLQFKKDRAAAIKDEASGISSLVDVALKISKQETDTLRTLNEDLKAENHELKEDNKCLREALEECQKNK